MCRLLRFNVYHLLLRTGYYWPNMYAACLKYSKACPQCQFHAPIHHQSAEPLKNVIVYWPFSHSGLGLHWTYLPSFLQGS